MTPIHTDLMKYSTPAAPTEHERQAFRSRRHACGAALPTLTEKILSRMTRFAVAVKRFLQLTAEMSARLTGLGPLNKFLG